MNSEIGSFSRKRLDRTIKFPDGHSSYVNREIYQLRSPVPYKKFKNISANPPVSSFNLDFVRNLKSSKYTRISESALKHVFNPFRKMLFERLGMIENESAKEAEINLTLTDVIHTRGSHCKAESGSIKGDITTSDQDGHCTRASATPRRVRQIKANLFRPPRQMPGAGDYVRAGFHRRP